MSTLGTNEILKLSGHKMKNPQWGWGSLNPVNPSLILRVWDCEMVDHPETGESMVMVLDKGYTRTDNKGYNDRVKHFNLLMQGVKVYYSIITPVDETADKWEIEKVRQCLYTGKVGISAVYKIGTKWYGILDKEVSFDWLDEV